MAVFQVDRLRRVPGRRSGVDSEHDVIVDGYFDLALAEDVQAVLAWEVDEQPALPYRLKQLGWGEARIGSGFPPHELHLGIEALRRPAVVIRIACHEAWQKLGGFIVVG